MNILKKILDQEVIVAKESEKLLKLKEEYVKQNRILVRCRNFADK